MGQFGIVDLRVEFESAEIADEICDDLEAKVTKFIEDEQKKNDKVLPFHFGIDNIDGDDTEVEISISSDRVQNAEWRAEMVHDFLIKKHFKDVVRITAEVNVPTNLFFWDKEFEDEE